MFSMKEEILPGGAPFIENQDHVRLQLTLNPPSPQYTSAFLL